MALDIYIIIQEMSISHSRPAGRCETYRLPGSGDSDSVGWDRPWWGLEISISNKDPGDSYHQENLADAAVGPQRLRLSWSGASPWQAVRTDSTSMSGFCFSFMFLEGRLALFSYVAFEIQTDENT